MVSTRRDNTAKKTLTQENEFKREDVRTDRKWFAKRWGKQTLTPSAEAYASRKDLMMNRYVAIDGTGFVMDGASCMWQKEDAHWFFPPLTTVSRAIQHWLRSESRRPTGDCPAWDGGPGTPPSVKDNL